MHSQPTTTDADTAAGSDELSTQQHPAHMTVNGQADPSHGPPADSGTATPRRPMSEDIGRRQRRYLIMMGFCIACFWITIILFLNHFGWLAAIPAVPTLLTPFVAVVLANAGHELDNVRGFTEYRPNLAERGVSPMEKTRATGSKARETGLPQGETRSAA